jgi:N-glycosidase YbiA
MGPGNQGRRHQHGVMPAAAKLQHARVSFAVGSAMEKYPSIPPDGRILFFRRDRASFGFLSHFHPAPIQLDDEIWPTVEHYFQAQRSDDPDYRRTIKHAVSPGMAKRFAAEPDAPRRGSQQSWFRKHGKRPRPDWTEVMLEAMRRADWAKFSQHPDLAALLLGTGSAELIEDSPFEPFWGEGLDGRGQNWAGRVLMEVRQRLLSRGCK